MTKDDALTLVGELIESGKTPEEIWADPNIKLRMIRGALADEEFDEVMVAVVMPRRIAKYLKDSLAFLSGRSNFKILLGKVADEIDKALKDVI